MKVTHNKGGKSSKHGQHENQGMKEHVAKHKQGANRRKAPSIRSKGQYSEKISSSFGGENVGGGDGYSELGGVKGMGSFSGYKNDLDDEGIHVESSGSGNEEVFENLEDEDEENLGKNLDEHGGMYLGSREQESYLEHPNAR